MRECETMRIKFIGVGEAFDEELPNTSIWLRAGEGSKSGSILLDCGFTVPPQFWKNCADANDLDAIWISHFHGDHFFGLPALLVRFAEMKRSKPLLIIGQSGIEDLVHRTMELSYPSIMRKFGYPVLFQTIEPGGAIEAAGATWRVALNGHPQKDLAVRIEIGGKSVLYSGDGPSTGETLSLARDADLVIHEAFSLDRAVPGHGNIKGCIDFALKAKARLLALVHIERNERCERRKEISQIINAVKKLQVLMPEPGDTVQI